ncbi:uncharacterized protein LOC143610739 [Bidens hawaiensis]|uniref:uncharacterized protein LOC143610739 n=1 Tax=Bidens hawaiensis TaxID=980011 RepID=UPI004048FA28
MASTTITKFAHLQIPLEDVVKATNDFHDDNIIGHGGFGQAYKGRLQRFGKLIDIVALRLDRKQGEGDVEFWTEVSVLSDLKHTNIVSIIGFCDEQNEKIIITTRAAKGSLKEHLNSQNLTWTQRLKICVGVARAMSYLHYDEERGYGVIHLNINSSTILLDENWEPKLSGFKVSFKQSLNRMDRVILSEPIGTIGYVDPEIEKTKGVSHKSDVYSFGVVLFELLCGRRAYIKNEANRFLARLAKYHYENETLQDIIHPDLKIQMFPYSLRIYSKIAYSCLEKERANRPHILIIVDKLEKALNKALKFRPHFGKNLEHLKIQLEDIKLATQNFSNTYKTGSNEYYTAYKVELDHFDREKPSSIEGKNTTSQHSHLLGFCVEGFDMMLVTENFSNEYLRHYLGNVKEMCGLTWVKRLKICIDVAHALNYIHFEMEDKKMLIHGNINTARIGFTEKWEAKIEDFEWAVFLPQNQKDEALYTKINYDSWYHVDPEYIKTGRLTRGSDVYSFGVVLFEIICGRHAYNQIYLKESEKGLVDVVRQNFCMDSLDGLIDPILKEESGINKDSLHTFLKVANQCVTETQDQRPTMKVILKELEKALFYQVNQINNLEHLMIRLADIKLATDDFSDAYKIRSGDGFTLYRAELDHFGKEHPSSVKGIVIMKRYHSGEKEFFTEIEMLSSMILIIDNFSNGHLGACLINVNDKRILTWEKRLHVCVDVAHALKYMHHEMEDQKKIINRDICSYNIVLDENWGAKIVDFWWSVFLPPSQEDEALYLKWTG